MCIDTKMLVKNNLYTTWQVYFNTKSTGVFWTINKVNLTEEILLTN